MKARERAFYFYRKTDKCYIAAPGKAFCAMIKTKEVVGDRIKKKETTDSHFSLQYIRSEGRYSRAVFQL